MRFRQRFGFQGFLQRYLSSPIIVEGKKDIAAMQVLGFEKVYAIHATGVPLRERISQIALLVDKKESVCILTDFDKKGRQLHALLRQELQMLGVNVDGSLRSLVSKTGISHIEGLDRVVEI